ncbi:helix-turn-helix domain-containing protein [Rhodalgimonas zhirmunskyi]|uniref:Helix-turn-helix domain-containing protein n=1 Tax=Rhodalgimonas zhirmunskyi TaxID=2964767 RepID=A0AAJ1UG31_9RHOB|nr:helix-turn-helix transcriptional regulator [Rhodoalgimonas zhirmunskyi]MDQ2095267.1 helix-turn-helix domain-containing protein [Rhodoalgimonas zhirmunskyi]
MSDRVVTFPGGFMTISRINDVDRMVGKRIQALRKARGLSQSDLAAAAGVRFQQIQKYESGANRVSASRLWAISDALDVEILYFFEGIAPEQIAEKSGEAVEDPMAFLRDPEALEILTLLKSLPKTKKSAVLSIVRSMAL